MTKDVPALNDTVQWRETILPVPMVLFLLGLIDLYVDFFAEAENQGARMEAI